MNEELRSATEALETNREALQSINEELTTVNHELKGKVNELAHANSDLQNLIAATTAAAVFLSRDLCITRFTPSAVSIFNLMSGDLGRPLADLASILDYPQMIADAQAVLEDLVPREREVAGGSRWYLARTLPYRTGDDRIAGVVLTFLDITSRKSAELALRLSEERFRNIVSQASAGVCHSDLDRRITLVNTRYSEITGYLAEQLVGRSMFAITHPDDRERSGRLFSNMLEDGQPYEIEKRYIRGDGAIVWVNNAVTLVRDNDGRPDSAISISLDITGRKEAETALHESNERLRYSEERIRAVLDNAVEYAIITMDLERRITGWNVGAERILGSSEASVMGHLADIIFTPEDCAAHVPEQEAITALREGRAADERFHLRKDQSRFWGSGVMTPLRDAEGAAIGLLKIFRDTSEQRASQEALEHGRRELEQALAEKELGRLESERASRAKDRFLAMLSHELRTPLTPVVMATHALERVADLPEPVRATLAVIRRNVRAEMVLIDDLLDLTRISSGKLEMTPESIDLHDAVRGAVEVCEAEFRSRQQVIELHLDAGRFRAEGDFHRLRQVFWNLLRNASKFSPLGGRVGVRTSNVEDRFVLSVSDSGIGIEPEKLITIFDAFEQGGEQISREFGGLGLGLAIAKAMVDGHHGTLHAKSAGSGQGATFTVELPLQPS
ncbi:MAG: PAS domain S-box protein [Pseudomonadota bacterium]|nr:PAS domain S-box protein [Pseudomonadota bacterium]